MRSAGRITEWNDDKGFGFVVPHGGGDRAFVHVRAFQRGSRRPVEGDLVSYTVAKDPRGRRQARDVRHAGQKIAAPRAPSRIPRMAIGVVALLVVALLALAGVMPLLVAGTYLGLSAVAYLMYYVDKEAAGRRAQRTPEKVLHLLGLLGGWPGALAAQQRFRHKTAKASFQAVFWATVVANVAGAAWLLATGDAGGLLQALRG